MEKNKLFTIVIISVVGVGLLILFINILSNENTSEDQVVTEQLVEESVVAEANVEEIVAKEQDLSEESEQVVQDQAEESVLTGENVYSAFVEYLVPKGYQDSLTVNMEIEDGVVTDVSIKQDDSNPESTFYQEQFALKYKEEVVGKKVEEIDLSRVGGASLTTMAFMDAVDEIISQM